MPKSLIGVRISVEGILTAGNPFVGGLELASVKVSGPCPAQDILYVNRPEH